MGPTTYALCQKSLLGPVMWIAGLCAFPPLFSGVELPLSIEGKTIEQAFSVEVDRKYRLMLDFEFSSTEARLNDEIVGTNYDARCDGEDQGVLSEKRKDLGRPIPLKVVIRQAGDSSIVIEKTFTSLCLLAHVGNKKTRPVGWLELKRGEYIAEIKNVSPQKGLETVRTTVLLGPGGGK